MGTACAEISWLVGADSQDVHVLVDESPSEDIWALEIEMLMEFQIGFVSRGHFSSQLHITLSSISCFVLISLRFVEAGFPMPTIGLKSSAPKSGMYATTQNRRV